MDRNTEKNLTFILIIIIIIWCIGSFFIQCNERKHNAKMDKILIQTQEDITTITHLLKSAEITCD